MEMSEIVGKSLENHPRNRTRKDPTKPQRTKNLHTKTRGFLREPIAAAVGCSILITQNLKTNNWAWEPTPYYGRP